MFGLFGVTTYSTIVLYEKLMNYCHEHELRLARCRLPEHKLISSKWLFDNYRDNHLLFFDRAENLRHIIQLLQNIPVVVVICDSPLALAQFSPIIYLDNGDIDHEFFLSNLSFNHLNGKLSQLKKFTGRHITVTIHKFDIISNLLQEMENNILHYYHTLTMVAVRPSYRNVVINYLLRYLFGDIDSDTCHESIIPLLVVKYRDYLINFEKYMARDIGKNLLMALHEIREELFAQNLQNASNKEINSTIGFDKVALAYDIEQYDLRYLTLAYRRQLQKNIKTTQ